MAQIKTFARLKPSKKPYTGYEVNKNVLTIHMPESKDFLTLDQEQPFHSNVSYDIGFTRIFDPPATQEVIFDGVAKDIIENFLKGYNGTIFAYGQTGTGKTYTVEGNALKYKSRGLATRALSMIYEELEQRRKDEQITVYLSYLEIYQEVAYDLLSVNTVKTNMSMAPFAKVKVIEGPQGSCIMPNLSRHIGGDEEVAQMLLFQGQANRRVAETPVNMRSSRSHGVFTVYLQARKNNSDVMISSKLHLVDLAGSERVSKTGVDGRQLTEAKSINLSLHHLETVIIALQAERASSADHRARDKDKEEKNPTASRSNSATLMSTRSTETRAPASRYVPYRNSLLTMVLKDSLGGNCLTAMIATMSLEAENLGESISTCRFAQRVACVANNARRNEELDDKTLIRRLKNKVAHLEKQVAALRSKGKMAAITDGTGIEVEGLLSEDDRMVCAQIMDGYIQGVVTDPVAAGICDQCRFRECLHLLRERFVTTEKSQNQRLAVGTALNGEIMPLSSRHHDSGDHAANPSPHQIQNSVSDSCQIKPTAVKEGWVSTSVPANVKTSIFSNHTNNEKSVSACVSDKKKVQKEKYDDMEKKVDDISQLLQAISKDKYRSPYERQREKEIRRLSRKLNHLEESQDKKTEELEDIKKNVQVDQMQTQETNLRLKLKVAEDQVTDQRAYLKQLKHIQADPELVEREVLVEKHLVKRQTKFETKLKELIESREQLEASLQGSTGIDRGQEKKSSVEDKFGAFRQGKGAMNTRQVFMMLKNEEKKMQKESDDLDREKVIIKTKHLAMKEEATLEKLRDLKLMLKQSQHFNGMKSFSAHPSTAVEQTKTQPPNPHNNIQTKNFLLGSGEKSDPREVLMNGDSPVLSQCSQHTEDKKLLSNSKSNLLSQYSNIQKNSELESWGRNNQNICNDHHQSSMTNFNPHLMTDQVIASMNAMHDPHPSHKFSAVDGEKCVPAARQNKLMCDVDRNNNSNNNNINSFPDGWEEHNTDNKKHITQNNSHTTFVDHDEELKVSDLVSHPIVSDTNGSYSSSYSILNEARFTHSGHALKASTLTSYSKFKPSSSTHVSSSTVLPSEYINSMSSKEEFDARKMGLSSRTFDSALSYMLDSSAPDMRDYDKYARTPSSPYQQRLGGRPHGRMTSTASRSPSRSRTKNSKSTIDAQSTWGPDSKEISIADRLHGFLESDVETNGYSAIAKPPKPGQRKSLNKDAFLNKLGECQSVKAVPDASSSDDDSFFGSKAEKTGLKALSEEAREKTIVTRGQAERERVAKIRRAQAAASTIQRCWKKFQTKQKR